MDESKYKDIRSAYPSWDIYANHKKDLTGRLNAILCFIKEVKLIDSYKSFAEGIGENSVGLNDLKKGRKKLSLKHVKNMNKSYPYIDTDYILLGEGKPFKEKYLIEKKYRTIDEFTRERYDEYNYDLNIEMAKSDKKENTKVDLIESNNLPSKDTSKKINELYSELLKTKDQLLEAKNEIISLKDEIALLKNKE